VAKLVERLLNQNLRFRVQRRGCLIKNQNCRIFQKYPGHRNALLLSAGEHYTAFAGQRVKAIRQSNDKIVDMGLFSRLDQGVFTGIRIGEHNVVTNTGIKQKHILTHDADIAAQVWDLTPLGLSENGVSSDPFDEKYQTLQAVQIVGGPDQLNQPRNMAVAADGRIYVADTANHRIAVFSAAGEMLTTWGDFGANAGQFNEPWDVAIGPDGSVYVADTWNHRIQKFTPDGKFITAWGAFVSTDGQLGQMGVFWGPRAIAFTHDGNLLVTDTGNKRVQVFTLDGEAITQFGGEGVDNGYFDEPVGIAVDADGNIYVADTWNQRIQKFSPDFQFLKAWDVPGWDTQDIFMKPYLTVDQNGLVYAADPTGWRVLVWDSQGQAKAAFGEFGAGPGEFGSLNGVATAPDGSIWVADADNGRVMKFQPIQ